jgi:dTMP kinase
MSGRLVVLEGGEAAGKSTQQRVLATRLRERGFTVCETREPGGTALGQEIRALLLHSDGPLDARAELLLMLADRAQHVAEVLRPRIDAGEIVICDRYTPSTLAYQGVARGFGVEEVERMSAGVEGGVTPDVVVVLDLPDDVAESRIAASRDRLEREGDVFHAMVRAAYRDLAAERGWVVVDATGSTDDVAARVWDAVDPVVS